MNTDAAACSVALPTTHPVSVVAAQLSGHAQAAHATARKCALKDNVYGQALASARVEAYQQAADLVRHRHRRMRRPR